MDRRTRTLLISPFGFWLLFLVAGPFALIVATSFFRRSELGLVETGFELSAYRELFSPLYAGVLFRTFVMASLNTMLTLCAAFPIAFYMSRLPKKRAAWLLTFIMIPFWTNFLIRLLAFMDVLRLKPFGLELTYTYPGILLAMVYNYLPYAILPLYSTLEKIPQSVIEAALDLGAKKRQVLTRVVLPMAKSGLAAAGLLVFIPSLGEFLIPQIVGGGKNFFLGTFLQEQFLVSRNWPLGSAAIVFLILSSLFLVLLTKGAGLEDRRV